MNTIINVYHKIARIFNTVCAILIVVMLIYIAYNFLNPSVERLFQGYRIESLGTQTVYNSLKFSDDESTWEFPNRVSDLPGYAYWKGHAGILYNNTPVVEDCTIAFRLEKAGKDDILVIPESITIAGFQCNFDENTFAFADVFTVLLGYSDEAEVYVDNNGRYDQMIVMNLDRAKEMVEERETLQARGGSDPDFFNAT